jgi:ribonuclease Z
MGPDRIDAMVQVDLLGTGTPFLDPERCGSGTAVSSPDGWLLIDCGRGVTQRVAEAGLDLHTLRAVLLTHHHSDHVSDLATLATARWTSGAAGPLVVIAPDGPCATFARSCLGPFGDQAFYSQAPTEAGPRPVIEVLAFVGSSRPNVVLDLGPFRVSSALVDHHPIEAAVGYRIGVGSVSIAIRGDTAACPGFEALAQDADLLIHEALLARAMSASLLEWNASAESVGALARRAGATRLVLTHLLPPPRTADAEQLFVDDARAGGFEGPIDVARDLLRIRIEHEPTHSSP